MANNQYINNLKPWIMWFILMLFLMFQLLIRKTIGALEMSLESHFNITAQDYGFGRSIYNLGYGWMQIPLGIMLDRFGPRYISFTSLLSCILGLFLFMNAPNWTIACIAQTIIGIGSSGAFISCCKILKNWFPDKMFSFLVGCSIMIGLFGMIFGGIATGFIIKNEKLLFIKYFENIWQNVLLNYALIGSVISILLLIFIRNDKNKILHNKEEESWNFKSFKKIVLSPRLIIIAIIGALLVGPFEIAVSYNDAFFTRAYDMNITCAVTMSAIMLFGFALANPLIAILGEKFGNRKLSLVCAFLMFICKVLVVYKLLGNNIHLIRSSMFLLGISSGYQVLMFAMAAKSIKSTYSATAVSIVQFANMAIGSAAFPYIFGLLMDKSFTSRTAILNDKNLIYTTVDYQYAFLSVLICCTLGFIGLLFLSKKITK